MTIVFQSRATYDSVRFNAGPGPNYSSLGRYLVLIFYWSFRHISFPIPICKWKMPFVTRRVRRFVFKFLVFLGVVFFLGGVGTSRHQDLYIEIINVSGGRFSVEVIAKVLSKLLNYFLINEITCSIIEVKNSILSLRPFSMPFRILETVNKTQSTKIEIHQPTNINGTKII